MNLYMTGLSFLTRSYSDASSVMKAFEGMFIATFWVAIAVLFIVFTVSRNVKRSRQRGNALGVFAFVVSLLALIGSALMLWLVNNGVFGVYSFASAFGVSIPFSWKCWSFVAGYWWVLLIGASLAACGIIAGVVYLSRKAGKEDSPRWLGFCAVELSVMALCIMAVILCCYFVGASEVKSSLDSLGGLYY